MVLDGEKAFILSGTKYIYPKIVTQAATGQAPNTTMKRSRASTCKWGSRWAWTTTWS